MYMLVFITLVIGLVNIYAQVLVVQTQRLAQSQVGLARTMQQWQVAAISMANSIYYENGAAGPATTAGCSLSISPPTDASNNPLALCAPPNNSGDTNGTVTKTTGGTFNQIYNHNTNAVEPVHLPPGYDAGDYQFYSVYVQDTVANQSYVVTFVKPPTLSASNPAPGFLTLAGGYQTSQTQADLMQQFVNAHIPNYTYGIVKSSVVTMAGGGIGTTPLTYSFTGLAAGVIPDNSVAMVGSPVGF